MEGWEIKIRNKNLEKLTRFKFKCTKISHQGRSRSREEQENKVLQNYKYSEERKQIENGRKKS